MTGEPLRDLRLGAQGQIFVSLAAARSYASATGTQPEEARRELTEYLIDARVTGEEGDTLTVRARSRGTGLDIQARVAVDGRLLVVVHVHARETSARSPSKNQAAAIARLEASRKRRDER